MWHYTTEAVREKFNKLRWYEVYDFIEFIINRFDFLHGKEEFTDRLNEIFEKARAPYRIVGNHITPLTSKVAIEEIEKALEIQDKYQPIKNHLNKAIDLFSKRPTPDSANSIKESISSLEALARIVLKKPKATLGNLVDKLPIHQAFRETLKKLYGWTSDESGIRHSETGEKIASGEEEARFMLVISSSFVNYIIAKYNK